jgi:hypothetical protein
MHEVHDHTADAAFAAIGSKVTYTGAGTAVFAWLTSSQAGVLAGIVLGIVGFLVNLYFKRREDKRQQVEHDARMRAIRGEYL